MALNKHRILVVEDIAPERDALARLLRLEKYDVKTACGTTEALNFMGDSVDLVISDVRLGQDSALDILRVWLVQQPRTPFILLTAYGNVDTAVAAIKLGAREFLTKPVDPVELLNLIRCTLSACQHHAGSLSPLERINEGLPRAKLIGRSQPFLALCAQTLRAAERSRTVLLLGESGTGKELIAEALHRKSERRAGPFVVVNMAGIPESLAESELFGHVKGAFTGATANRIGCFEAAHTGTLFIDEIGDFPLPLQAKLLRVLETRTVTPIGCNRVQPVDVTVIAATSRPIAKLVQDGEFRAELYYRLNVIAIQLPPLRQRRQDISLLAAHFLEEYSQAAGRKAPRITSELLRELEAMPWPGNVRQLRNCLERMCVLGQNDLLTLADLPADFREPGLQGSAENGARLESVKRSAILQALEQFDGNRTRAARFLGISVRTLQRKLHEWAQ